MITLNNPLYFSEIGKKDNQEDYIYPSAPDTDSNVFILCDGMGGHERGEVASSTVANTLGAALEQIAGKGKNITSERFETALGEAYDALDSLPVSESDRKPGTTLACVCFNDQSFIAAHIGDSRVYQIRPANFDAEAGKTGIIYRSEDHSLVNDLVRAGQITPEQARNHPRRNVITRAMQPGLERRFKATMLESADIKPGDYFFLCSDGVLERVSDATLCEILATPEFTDQEKIDAIKAECNLGTRDNFSCILIPVADVTVLTAKRQSYTIPLAILTGIVIVAGAGVASFYTGGRGANTALDGVAAPAAETDTAVTDTLLLATPITDTIAADTVKIQPVTAEKNSADSAASKHVTDTLRHSPQPKAIKNEEPVAQPAPEKPTAETKPEAPEATTTEQTGAVPPKPKKTDSKSVPPRKKKETKPQPLI